MLMVSIIPFGFNRLELPAYKKGLPQCTAGYETWIMHHASWITGATLIEIGAYIIGCEILHVSRSARQFSVAYLSKFRIFLFDDRIK